MRLMCGFSVTRMSVTRFDDFSNYSRLFTPHVCRW